jgi:hypothetical protein
LFTIVVWDLLAGYKDLGMGWERERTSSAGKMGAAIPAMMGGSKMVELR